MLRIPAFKSHLRVEIVAGQGVVLLSDDGARALHGKTYELLAATIDGRRSTDQIVERLSGQVDAARIYYALGQLETRGHLCEAAPQWPLAASAFWHGAEVDPGSAAQATAAARIRVRRIGSVDPGPMRSALAQAGLTLTEDESASMDVVVADDHLRAGLHDINAEALRTGRPWLLVKPLGHEVWVGPLFVPGQTGCHRCLSHRLLRNRPVHQWIARLTGQAEPPMTTVAALPSTIDLACRLATVEVLKHLAGVQQGLAGQVLSVDVRSWATERHPLQRRPDCPVCGAAKGGPREQAAGVPLRLVSRPAAFSQDGGHRSTTPEQTFAQYRHLVSPITGVVRQVQPVYSADGVAHVYMAGHNPAIRMDGLDALKHSLRNVSSGKGASQAQARASALCEALERHCGEFTGLETVRMASFRELGQAAVHPNAVMRFSPQQYAHRAAWNARRSKFNQVPEPLDEDDAIAWTPVWSLTEERHKYLPTELLYYGAPAAPSGRRYSMGCSNGSAAGNSREEAVLQGFLELAERDAVAIWWYNRLPREPVDVASFGQPWLLELTRHYESLGRELWALDLSSDLGIPTFVAVSRLRNQPQERILFGFGCHLDARVALQRAFAEANQMLGMARGGETGELVIEDDETLEWLAGATLDNQPHLRPRAGAVPRSVQDYPAHPAGDLLADIRRCQQIVEERGMEMLVLDQTRADVGLPVVKVVVPGLRHFWARFAPGRLYDVPVRMGWLDERLREDQLNPVPIFF